VAEQIIAAEAAGLVPALRPGRTVTQTMSGQALLHDTACHTWVDAMRVFRPDRLEGVAGLMDLVQARRMFGGLPVANVATVGPGGVPHVVPLWFVWAEEAIYVSTRRPSRTWSNANTDPRVSLAIDLGRSWVEIAGIVVEGSVEPLAADHPSMRKPISAWHEKYRSLLAGDGFGRFSNEVEHLTFLRIVPVRIRTWDHARA
jgi:hypothetical protein